MELKVRNVFIVYTKRIAIGLIKEGFDLIKVEDNIKKIGFKVFIFNNSEELQDAIKELNNKDKNKK